MSAGGISKNMFAKPGWFGRRKYTGWGLTPKTWQGWVYTLVLVLPFIVLAQISIGESLKTGLMIAWGLFLIFELGDIMVRMKKDEREEIHEAVSERNALWVIIMVLTAGIGYQAATSIIESAWGVDPVILIALVAGLIAKAVSNYYLDKKD
jgi:hypothetical protein